jgi:hypothetical protein
MACFAICPYFASERAINTFCERQKQIGSLANSSWPTSFACLLCSSAHQALCVREIIVYAQRIERWKF